MSYMLVYVSTRKIFSKKCPSASQVLMLSSLGSQWLLAGSSLVVVVQQNSAPYGPVINAHLEAGRANLAFLSALCSAFGMVAALCLKFVDGKAEEKEKEGRKVELVRES